eukprot:gene18362-24058_t
MDSSNESIKRRRIIITDNENEEYDDVNNVIDDNDNLSQNSNPDEILNSDPEEEEEGEDLAETWMADYAPAPELDYYDPEGLASEDEVKESYDDIVRYRKSAEKELDLLDAKRRQMEDDADDSLEALDQADAQELQEYEDEEDDDIEEIDKEINLEAFECPLREWISEERTRREIHRRFRTFLLTYYPGIEEVNRFLNKYKGESQKPPLPSQLKVLPAYYPPRIKQMCSQNSSSLEISYVHLSNMQSLLALWLTDVPKDILQIFDEVLKGVVLTVFPNYLKITQELHVRIINLPIADRLRDLRQVDLNNLIKVTGVITRRTSVFPMMKAIAYDCNGCGTTVGPYKDSLKPGNCPSCNGINYKINNQKTEYSNYQKLTLQESPGTVPPGRVPRYKEVILLGDLIDIARPGEEIEVTGIYTHNNVGFSKDKNGFPVFGTIIEANSILKKNVSANIGLSDEDRRILRELSLDPQIRERIIKSIAPSIYGHRHIKTAVALSLFGGCAKESGTGGTHRVRGDINVLLLGDPGTAKSQILKYAEKVAPRAVYTAGKGASAVGLTAGVHRDPTTKEWTLEGGALVLADQGVCLIDEFDKMNEQDRTSIHEAMEQQTISVSKAGIVTSLQARCGVIAAANPIGGRYDPSFAFSENVELTDPILQRFDILCVLQDVVDPIIDEKLATFVVRSHVRSHPDYDMENDDNEENIIDDDLLCEDDNDLQPIDQSTLKKYITYAKACVRPILHDIDSEKIASLYADLRKQSALSGGVPIAVRHIESVMRMAEASAKMQLRDHVRDDDVDMAIKVMLDSFLQAQKISIKRILHKNFRKYITFGEETNQLLMHQLRSLIADAEKYKALRGSKSMETTESDIQTA